MMTWLTLGEVVNYLKMRKSTIYKFVREGNIPIDRVDRIWWFDAAEPDMGMKAGMSMAKQEWKENED